MNRVKKLVGAAALAASSCLFCVARGSRVRTPRGERLIEELAVGDEVLCVDPVTGVLVAAALREVRSAVRECVSLSFAGVELVVTSDHPLYCPATREWAPAGDWALGRRTQLLHVDGETVAPVAVERVSAFAGVRTVFDLTVEHPLHNFVANGALVHNKSRVQQCDVETVSMRAETTCGQSADLTLSSTESCGVLVTGGEASGLPATGETRNNIRASLSLSDSDGGAYRECITLPRADGDFDIRCTRGNWCTGDGGCDAGTASCEGTLTER
jgi:hypothetical protein